MNGHRAKSIRQSVYNDQSTKPSNRSYSILKLGEKLIKWVTADGKDREFIARINIVRSEGLRRQYQQSKTNSRRRQGSTPEPVLDRISRTWLMKRERAIQKGKDEKVERDMILKRDKFLATANSARSMTTEQLRRKFALRELLGANGLTGRA